LDAAAQSKGFATFKPNQMARNSLLRRVKLGQADNRRATDADIRDSVLEHLRVMCSTRQATMTTCPDFGVCDVSEMLHAFPDAIADMARSIRHTIQTYEPRLANVRIRHIPTEDMTLRFEITAQLAGQAGKSAVSFETSVDATRRVSVR